MEEENEKNSEILQQKRKDKIPLIIEKLEALADKILETVGGDFPTFNDVTITKDEETIVKVTAENQLYAFVKDRKDAVLEANRIMKSVNYLELELYNPEALLPKEDESELPTKPEKRTRKPA